MHALAWHMPWRTVSFGVPCQHLSSKFYTNPVLKIPVGQETKIKAKDVQRRWEWRKNTSSYPCMIPNVDSPIQEHKWQAMPDQ